MHNGSHPILKNISADERVKLIFVSLFIPTSSPGFPPHHSFFCLFPSMGKSVVFFFARIPAAVTMKTSKFHYPAGWYSS
jgi:hypothetical protein